MNRMINEFKSEYAFLSNFWGFTVPVVLEGMVFYTVEHAYQAAKTVDWRDRHNIASIKSPGAAKRFGRSVKIRSNWDEIKISVMIDLVDQKFCNNQNLMNALLLTEGAELVEGNTWHDNYWGVCNCPDCRMISAVGQNNLGRILMTIRDTILFKNGDV